jgi:hypothetical protein
MKISIPPLALGAIIPEICRTVCTELNEECCKVWEILLPINYHPKLKNVSIRVYQYKNVKEN